MVYLTLPLTLTRSDFLLAYSSRVFHLTIAVGMRTSQQPDCCLSCRSFYDRALAIDVREYAPYVVAEVTVSADSMKDANSKGFRQVFHSPGLTVLGILSTSNM